MLRDFKPRLYQETILATCIQKNTLVVLPTGLGKTAIALLLAVHRIKQYPDSKILVLAPTKPLAEQHMISFKKYLDVDESQFKVFTGATSPEKREELWKKTKFIFCTPQTVDNDVISGRIRLEDVSLVVFDEAHRATGDYSYTFLAKQYYKRSRFARILALTASPGSEKEKIHEILKNLKIEEIELRTEKDPDVKPYVQTTTVNWEKVELTERFKQVQKYLEQCYKTKLQGIKETGFINSTQLTSLSKKELLSVMKQLHSEISSGNKEFSILKGVSLVAEAMKVQHALEMLVSQGVGATFTYMQRLMNEARSTKVKAIKNLTMDLNFKSAYVLVRNMYDDGVEHPKILRLEEILKKELGLTGDSSTQTTITGEKIKPKDKKIIIFTQYRDSGNRIVEKINLIEGIKAKLFVGQSKKAGTGLSQKKQIELIDDFRKHEFNVIVMTSVGEEGLDIPQVDMVIFYEPIPSAIRTVQRRGRTGRLEEGKVTVLYAKGTRDEAYMWVAFRKEKRMHKVMDEIKKENGFSSQEREKDEIENLSKVLEEKKYSTVENDSKPQEEIKIIVDSREKGSQITKDMIDRDVKIELRRLDVGDYILSHRVGVEYKNVGDFVDSIVDGRLLQQVKLLKQTYDRPLIIVEGIEDIYSMRKIHPNAIMGMLSTIAISYGVPVLYTKNFKETTSLLHVIAKREQIESNRPIQLHSLKPWSKKEAQEYVVASFPGIGATLNKPLLNKFKTIKNIVNAKKEELKEVEKIGDKKAEDLIKIFSEEYEDES